MVYRLEKLVSSGIQWDNGKYWQCEIVNAKPKLRFPLIEIERCSGQQTFFGKERTLN
jgi:hypothetical protein